MPNQPSVSAIYGIRHVESGRLYVGSAVNLFARWRQHRSQLNRGKHHSRHLQAAWCKYGADAFEFVVLETVPAPEHLLDRENFWIAKYMAADNRHGFNCCPSAGSQFGMRHSQETRKKMSDAHSGRQKTTEHQSAINASLKGRTLSDQCKKKLAAARRGTSHSDATRSKMSESRKGKTASPESRAKISAAMKARHAEYRNAGVTISGKPLMGYALKQELFAKYYAP